MAGMLFCGRQSDRDCLIAVCTRVRDLIALTRFLSKDAVINSLRLLVAGATQLHIALQGGTAPPPLSLNGPLVLDVLQLQVVHLVGTALLEIQLCTFWLHCSLLCFVGFLPFAQRHFAAQKTKPFLAVPGASPHALSRPRSLRLSERSEEP